MALARIRDSLGVLSPAAARRGVPPPDAFAAVLDELRDIRAEHVTDPEVPLDVHPLLLSTGRPGGEVRRPRDAGARD